MREIKFRAWYNNELFNFVELTSYNDGSLGINISTNGFHGLTTAPEETILEQYTGLKDKNGVDIYEGDVTNNGVVEWFDSLTWDSGGSEHSGFYLNPIRYDLRDGDLEYHLGFDEDIEVIGNIHQNPELLE